MSSPQGGLSFLPAAVESARQTALLLRHNRIGWLLTGIAGATGLLALFLGSRAHDRLDGRTLFCMLAWWLQGTVLVPWSTLYLGVQAVHGGLEDRTFQYLFLRPVGRAPLLLGKWLAVFGVSAVVGLFGAVALFLGVAARAELWPDGVDWSLLVSFARAFVLAAIAYSAVAVLFGAFFRRPLVWAAFFVVGLQTLTANLPVSAGLRRMTITDPLRRLVLDSVEPDSRLATMLWPAERSFRPELIGEPLLDLAVLVLVCLVLATWSYCRTEYDSRVRE